MHGIDNIVPSQPLESHGSLEQISDGCDDEIMRLMQGASEDIHLSIEQTHTVLVAGDEANRADENASEEAKNASEEAKNASEEAKNALEEAKNALEEAKNASEAEEVVDLSVAGKKSLGIEESPLPIDPTLVTQREPKVELSLEQQTPEASSAKQAVEQQQQESRDDSTDVKESKASTPSQANNTLDKTKPASSNLQSPIEGNPQVPSMQELKKTTIILIHKGQQQVQAKSKFNAQKAERNEMATAVQETQHVKQERVNVFKKQVFNVDKFIKEKKLEQGTDFSMAEIRKLHKNGGAGHIDFDKHIVKVTSHKAEKLGSTIKIPINGEMVEFKVETFTEEELKQFEDQLEEHYVTEQQILVQNQIAQKNDSNHETHQEQPPVFCRVEKGPVSAERKRSAETAFGVPLPDQEATISQKLSLGEKIQIAFKKNLLKLKNEQQAEEAAEKKKARIEKDEKLYDIQQQTVQEAVESYSIAAKMIEKDDAEKGRLFADLQNVLLHPIQKWNLDSEKQAEILRVLEAHGVTDLQGLEESVVAMMETHNTAKDDRSVEFYKAIITRMHVVTKVLGPA